MKIADSIRQECMPEMIYSICKLVSNKTYKREEIKKLITVNSNSSQEYNKAYKFALECEFIREDSDGKVATDFTTEQLSSFRKFRYEIFKNIFRGETTIFNLLARWFLAQDSKIFQVKSAQDLAIIIPKDILGGKDRDCVLGFRFWMVALGLGMFSKSGNSNVLLFATNNILQDWLEFDKPFKKDTSILAKDFMNKLISECPVFAECINGNQINLALSMGLRVLHLNNIIELKYVTDSGDIWHLVESVTNSRTNKITEIVVR